jgi:hypothetical protein
MENLSISTFSGSARRMYKMAAIPYIALGITALGTGFSAYGQYQQGKAQREAYEQNAEISRQNAIAAEKQAAYEEDIQREKANALKSRQRALYAKAGVDITSGSPLLVMAEDMERAEADAQAIRYGGNVKKTQYLNQANMLDWSGEQAYSAGKTGAFSTILGGLGSMGMNYMKYKGKGSYYGYR